MKPLSSNMAIPEEEFADRHIGPTVEEAAAMRVGTVGGGACRGNGGGACSDAPAGCTLSGSVLAGASW